MDKLLRLLFENPILLFILGAWVFGAISNAAKAKGKKGSDGRSAPRSRRRRRREKKPAPTVQQPLPAQTQAPPRQKAPVARPAPQGRGPLAGSAAQTPEQIAREMRRILGLEPEPSPPSPPPMPASPPPIERPPAPIRVRTESREVGSRVDPHVGEQIRDRHMRESMVGKPHAGRSAIGSLGGRVGAREARVSRGSRYTLDDLRKAIVINEILSPPVGLRPHDDRRPT